MRYACLQDHIYRGLGKTARHTGKWADAFRPKSTHSPLSQEGRYLRLPAAFEPLSSPTGNDAFNRLFWRGIFDGAYTKPGDYLVIEDDVYFIVSQDQLDSIICVRTNRLITIERLPQIAANTSDVYGGFSHSNTTVFFSEYPAAVVTNSKMSSSSAGLPSDQAIPYWNVYLPVQSTTEVLSGDIVFDNMGRSAVVSYADQSRMGWHLIAKLAAV